MIKIGFSRTYSLPSQIIRWFTKESVSHAWILHEAYGSLYIMESETKGFRVVSYEHFKENNSIVYEHEVAAPPGRLNEVAEWLGDSYDWKSLAAFVLRSFGIWRGLNTPRKLICTEVVVRMFPELFPGVNPEWATPGQLMKILKDSNGIE